MWAVWPAASGATRGLELCLIVELGWGLAGVCVCVCVCVFVRVHLRARARDVQHLVMWALHTI